MGWFKFIVRPYYWFAMSAESLFTSGRSKYTKKLNDLRDTVKNPYDVMSYYLGNDFKWRQDLKVAGITLDLASAPWVTFKRKSGDCEDFMLLNEYLLSDIAPDSERWAVSNKDGEWHAILVFPYKDLWGLFSNTDFTVHKTRAEALSYFFLNDHNHQLQM